MRGCRRHVRMTEWLNKQLEWDGAACVNLTENLLPSICSQRAIGLLRGFGDSWSGLQRLRQPAKAVRAPGFEKTARRHPTTPPWAGSIHWWENIPFFNRNKTLSRTRLGLGDQLLPLVGLKEKRKVGTTMDATFWLEGKVPGVFKVWTVFAIIRWRWEQIVRIFQSRSNHFFIKMYE